MRAARRVVVYAADAERGGALAFVLRQRSCARSCGLYRATAVKSIADLATELAQAGAGGVDVGVVLGESDVAVRMMLAAGLRVLLQPSRPMLLPTLAQVVLPPEASVANLVAAVATLAQRKRGPKTNPVPLHLRRAARAAGEAVSA